MKTLKKPEWIKKGLFNNSKENYIKELINKNKLHTVCQEARCPNIGECFTSKRLTFLLLGNVCTRKCRFCNISDNKKLPKINESEPTNISKAVKKLDLEYVILTSVTRDDLTDGGASVFVKTVKLIKKTSPYIKIEVLIPDFQGNKESILSILNSGISVFGHNLETVKRLYSLVRPKANYERSINVLKFAKKANKKIIIKSGIMVGLGEKESEVIQLMKDFYNVGGDILTIGQYLQPGKNFYPVYEYIDPKKFRNYEKIAKKIGINKIFSSPFVRSSYLSEKFNLK